MITILEVSGEGCAGCRARVPDLPRLTRERGIPLEHLEASLENAARMKALKIEHLPTVFLLKDGSPFARVAGNQPAELLAVWLDVKLSEAAR